MGSDDKFWCLGGEQPRYITMDLISIVFRDSVNIVKYSWCPVQGANLFVKECSVLYSLLYQPSILDKFKDISDMK